MQQAVTKSSPGMMIAARVFYVIAALAFTIAFSAVLVQGYDIRVLMNSAQGLGVLTNGYQALVDMAQAIATWLVTIALGLMSLVLGMICGSFK